MTRFNFKLYAMFRSYSGTGTGHNGVQGLPHRDNSRMTPFIYFSLHRCYTTTYCLAISPN